MTAAALHIVCSSLPNDLFRPPLPSRATTSPRSASPPVWAELPVCRGSLNKGSTAYLLLVPAKPSKASPILWGDDPSASRVCRR